MAGLPQRAHNGTELLQHVHRSIRVRYERRDSAAERAGLAGLRVTGTRLRVLGRRLRAAHLPETAEAPAHLRATSIVVRLGRAVVVRREHVTQPSHAAAGVRLQPPPTTHALAFAAEAAGRLVQPQILQRRATGEARIGAAVAAGRWEGGRRLGRLRVEAAVQKEWQIRAARRRIGGGVRRAQLGASDGYVR